MISGLVIYLSSDSKQSELAIERIRARSEIETGDQCEHRLPVVAETETVSAMYDLTEWLQAVPGVLHVDVAFADVQEDAESSLPAQKPGRPSDR